METGSQNGLPKRKDMGKLPGTFRIRMQKLSPKKLQQANRHFTERVMNSIGSVSSLVFHTLFFLISFGLAYLGVDFDRILLVVTTIVSLEAIYLAIFIQMALNKAAESLDEVEEDIGEIQKDMNEIEKDVGEIEKDIDEIQKDVDEIQEEESDEETRERQNKQVLDKIELQLAGLIKQIEKMKGDLR